jgi:amidohydrolase
MIDKDRVKNLAEQVSGRVIEIRRHIHAHPELSFKEWDTSAYVASILTELNIPFEKKGNTGIVALLKGKNPGITIALRADMDALPIKEANNVPYKSQNEGVMHACGHDVHTSSLLGVTMLLNELKEVWNGTVKLIFQPGEEKLPGGASLLIAEGVLENPAPSGIIAQHVFPELEAGKAGFISGNYMASCDEIYMRVIGKGGHAALISSKEKGASNKEIQSSGLINPIMMASAILLRLEKRFKELSPHYPTILSFGKFIANGATNVIPGEAMLEGTFRTMDEEWRNEAHEIIKKEVNEEVKKYNGSCELRIEKGYPVLMNNKELTEQAKLAAEEYLGKENVIALEKRMTSEDFSYYTHQIPGCFYRLGTGNKSKGIVSGIHTPTFDIDEKALTIGPGLMTWIALKKLINN